jgi:probable HAF family extracellular repeat protein
MMRERWAGLIHVLASVFVLVIARPSLSQSLTWLGTLGGNQSGATGVSADGSVVVGWAYNALGQLRAFRWTAEAGMQDIIPPNIPEAKAHGVSADGTVVVGTAYYGQHYRAFRWSNQVMWDLGTLGGLDSEAYGVSADGTIVVGTAYNAYGQPRAFRWTPVSGMRDLGTFPGGNRSDAYGISADGSFIVGGTTAADGGYRAFRWSETLGMRLFLTRNYWMSVAYGVSADGTVIVGEAAGSPLDANGFYWILRSSGTADYWLSGGVYGVSGNGYTAVGRCRNAMNPPWDFRATIWEDQTVLGNPIERNLNQIYQGLLNGSHLIVASAISPDGRYIVGTGYNRATGRIEAFLIDRGRPLRGDVNRDCRVDDSDLLAVLLKFGERGYRNEDLNWDGMVDDTDLLIVIFNFGSGC